MSLRISLQTVILAAEAIQKDSEDRGVFLEAVKANSRLERIESQNFLTYRRKRTGRETIPR